jgi:tetratricopeptide (TPR) repeat protein
MTTKNARLDRLREALGPIAAKLSYHPQMALMETIFVRDHREEFLSREYHALLDQLLERTDSLADFDPNLMSQLMMSPLTDQSRKFARTFLRSALIGKFAAMLPLVLDFKKHETLSDDQDFQLMDRIYRVVISKPSTGQFDELGRWSDLLFRWSQNSTDPALAVRRFEESIIRGDQIINSPTASSHIRSQALIDRGVKYNQRGNPERAIADYTTVIEMVDAPVEQKANALFNRGVRFGDQGNPEREIADYTEVIEIPNVPAEPKAKALFNRGVTFCLQGHNERAITDFTSLVEMPDAPPDQKLKALGTRGWRYYEAGRIGEAITDLRLTITRDPKNANVLRKLAIALLVDRQTNDALVAYKSAIELADADGLAELEKVEAIAKHGALPGADEVRAEIKLRTGSLQATTASE